jgi:hypothetical protein
MPLGRSTATIGFDQDIGDGKITRIVSDAARPSRRHQRRVALEPGKLADQHDRDAKALLGQKPRRNEAVATIVSRAGDHRHAAAARIMRRHSLGDGPAGILHQVDARNPAGGRQLVGASHLGGRQKLKHGA